MKIAFCMSIGSFLSKKFIWEISIFSNLLRPRPKKNSFLSSNFRRRGQNCNLRVCRNILTDTTLFRKQNKTLSLSDNEWDFCLAPSLKTFGEVMTTAIYVSAGTFSTNYSLLEALKSFPSSDIERNIFWLFIYNYSALLWQTHSLCLQEHFWENFLFFFCFWKNYIIFSLNLDSEQNFFDFLSKFYRRYCENCILRIHSNTFMKIAFFTAFNFLNTFGHWPKKLLSLLKNFSTVSRRLNSTFK